MLSVRDPHRGQVSAAQQAGQLERVAAVGLDPVATSGRDQRRGHHHALHPPAVQLPVQCIARGASLVGHGQPDSWTTEPSHQLPQRRGLVRDLAVAFRVANLLGYRHRDRGLVHI
jgi:hypothetical protein